MPGQANVDDFEIFRVFRAAMLKFAKTAERCLNNADGEISRVRHWLETEQGTYWVGQLRKRTEAAVAARDAVRQKKLYLDSTGRRPSAVEEEKILAKCVRAVEEAQYKIEQVKRALPRLEKETAIFRGGVARLMGSVTVDIPKAVNLLDNLAARLEEYAAIEAPSAPLPDLAGSSTAPSFSRGDGEHVPAPAPETPASDEPPVEAAPDQQESPNVPG